MNTNTNTIENKMSENTKANIIAISIMAVVILIGVIYGMELDKIGY